MTDPNQPPASDQPIPAPGYEPPAPPAYGSAAPAYGAAPAAPQAYSAQAYGAASNADKWNVLAIISLVSSFFVSLAAVVCGHIALSQIKRTGERGRGLAIAGLVLGYLGILAGIIVAVAFIFAVIAAMNNGNYGNQIPLPTSTF